MTTYNFDIQYINGFYIRSSKEILPLSSINITYPQRVQFGDVVTYNGTLSGTSVLALVFDSNCSCVLTHNVSDGYTITIPENGKFIMFNVSDTSITISNETQDNTYLTDNVSCSNIISGDLTFDVGYLNNGVLTALNGYKTSNYIDITGKNYLLYINHSYTGNNSGALYDSGNKFIQTLRSGSEFLIKIPSNASKVRFTHKADNTNVHLYALISSEFEKPVNIGEDLQPGLYVDSNMINYKGKNLKTIIDALIDKLGM